MNGPTIRRRSTTPIPLLTAAAMLGLAGPAAAKVTLSDGHVDVGAARIVDGKLRSYVKDDTGDRVVWRDPASVVVRVVNKARVRLPAGMGFVGRRGQRVWMIPQAQKRGIIWAGWNTEEISRRQIRGGVAWKLRKVRGPGRVVVFQTGSFGDEDVLFSSRRRLPQTYTIAPGTHAHGNWAFTKRGTYKLRFTMSIRTRGGRRQRDNATLTFRVG
jgi:putative ABC transporter-associated repeat protein